jgi:ATP-dependent helicase/nuclease subunit B
MIAEIAQSKFIPADFELSLHKNGAIPPLRVDIDMNGKAFAEVEGKVDRIDVMEENGKKYLRIIDYKTGKKEFLLQDVLLGLNMQMLIYLEAILENGEDYYGKITPAGILYMPAVAPFVQIKRSKNLAEQLEKEKQKNLRMSGILLDDKDVVRGMEPDSKGVYVPAQIKNGEFAKGASVMSLDDLRELTRYPKKLIAQMAKNLHDGEVLVNPMKCENVDACEFCDYFLICGC